MMEPHQGVRVSNDLDEYTRWKLEPCRLAYRDIRIAKVISAEISAIVPFADWLG
jgi:hypothetical protein